MFVKTLTKNEVQKSIEIQFNLNWVKICIECG